MSWEVVRAAVPLLLVHVGLLATWDLAARPAATFGLLLLAASSLVWAVRRVASRPGSKAAAILLVALLLRLLLLPLPPTLSDDVMRYVWDGKVVGAGLNPYLLAPDDPVLESLRSPLWQSMSHRDVPTVYPPFALGLFSIAAHLPAPLLVLKILLTACDLLTCFFILRLAAAIGLPEERTIWYAWNPLPVLEFAGMGHVDALGVAAVVVTLFLLVDGRHRVIAAGLAGGVAVLSKLIPILAFPSWARSSRRPGVFLLSSGLVVALGLLPMLLSARGVPPGLTRFAISWEFNGPIYEPLWRLSERLDVRAGVEERLDRAKMRSGRHDFWNRFYPFNYPQLHAKLLLAAGLLVGLVFAWKVQGPIASTGAVFGMVLIFSATVYPWYAVWVLPSAALMKQRAWLLLSLLLPLTYLPQMTDLELFPWVFAAIWIPFFAVLIRYPRWSTD